MKILKGNSLSDPILNSLYASGWGRTTIGGPSPNNLQFFSTKTITNQECRSYGKDWQAAVFDSKICTFKRSGEGTCQGNSFAFHSIKICLL